MDPRSRVTQTDSTTFGPGEIVRLALDGRLRIPRLQRSFVWDQGDIVDLFDSIWKGYPVGTLLLWRRPEPAATLAFGSVPVAAPAVTDALVVVDGQQRLTTLVAALAPEPAPPVDQRFEVWFDLRTGRFAHAGRRRQVPGHWLPIRVALQSRTLLGWLRDHDADLSPDEIATADAVAGSIRDYKLPAYVVEQDDEALLRDVFDRVNSAGKPISRAQVFHALFGGTSDAASAGAVVEHLRGRGFGDLDEQRVVQSLLAIRGGNIARDLHNEFRADEDPAEWFDLTSQALSRVIGFLQRIGVPHLALVPSTFPVPVLAAFFHLHPEPAASNARLLARWVWRGWAHGYGGAGQTPALRRAIRAVNPGRVAPAGPPDEFDAVAELLAQVPDMRPDTPLTGFDAKSAASRLAMLALAERGPRAPGGDLLDLPALLGRAGAKAIAVFAHGRGSHLGARGLWDPGDPLPTGTEDDEVLASHAIDAESAAALRRGDDERFVNHRGEALARLVNGFLERTLEPDRRAVPPLEDLWVPDPA